MSSADILEQGMEQVQKGKRKVRIKWYVPTQLGRWFILFLKPTEDIPEETVKTIIEEIFHMYASSIVDICHDYGIDLDVFQQILNKKTE